MNAQKRTFVYYQSSEMYNRRSGGKILDICVHEIVNNLPTHCGNFSVKTISYKGAISEVMNFLSRSGIIGSEWDGYYTENDIFQIVGI